MDAQGAIEKMPRVFWKVCGTDIGNECLLNATESSEGLGMTELNDMNIDESLVTHLSAVIDHDPSVCVDVQYCYYQFAISNKDNIYLQIFSMRIEMEFYDPGNVDLQKSYKNLIQHGQFIRHEISPKTNPDMPYLKNLSIKLMSLQGDADLFVSFNDPNPD